MDDALGAGQVRRLQDVARAVDVGADDVPFAVQGQRRRRVHDDVDTRHGAVDGGTVPDIANVRGHAGSLRIVERRDIEARDLLALAEQKANQVDAEEPGPRR